MSARTDLMAVLSAAVQDIAEHGYDSQGRVEDWSRRIREAAERSLTPAFQLDNILREALSSAYRRLVERGDIARYHKGVARFTIERIQPILRAELDRRILASASLIKLNRARAINDTLQRFQGWSTSIPVGGSDVVSRPEEKAKIRKSLQRLPFEERRVIIDQTHKLRSSISEAIATEGEAIAGVWHSHWRQAGYDYRHEHKDRDTQVYTVRGNWALERGLMRPGPVGYTDDVTKPGEEVYCRCWYQWIYALRDLPSTMLTARGRDELGKAHAQTT